MYKYLELSILPYFLKVQKILLRLNTEQLNLTALKPADFVLVQPCKGTSQRERHCFPSPAQRAASPTLMNVCYYSVTERLC